jgi:hypothetical protein
MGGQNSRYADDTHRHPGEPFNATCFLISMRSRAAVKLPRPSPNARPCSLSRLHVLGQIEPVSLRPSVLHLRVPWRTARGSAPPCFSCGGVPPMGVRRKFLRRRFQIYSFIILPV